MPEPFDEHLHGQCHVTLSHPDGSVTWTAPSVHAKIDYIGDLGVADVTLRFTTDGGIDVLTGEGVISLTPLRKRRWWQRGD